MSSKWPPPWLDLTTDSCLDRNAGQSPSAFACSRKVKTSLTIHSSKYPSYRLEVLDILKMANPGHNFSVAELDLEYT